ncbi:MAG: cysteine desulfurase NifS [Candidatus Aminicenantia bacterium]
MIYLDNNATTPIDPRVSEKMCHFLKENFGNPSSLYPLGKEAKEMINQAREEIANAIGATKNEIIFTGSGTEADNFALRGILDAYPVKNEIITSSIEHPAIMSTCEYLEKKGFKVTYLPVDEYGVVDLNVLEESITDKTALISIMHANNEIGTIQPIEEISKIAKKRGVLVHTDAVQTFGKIEVDVNKLGVDLLSISAHKIYGPKGVGALYIKRGTNISPLIYGGHQERLFRAGTENTAGIIGFGEGAKIIAEKGDKGRKKIEKLAEKLKSRIETSIPKVKFNGHPEKRVKSTLNFSFIGLEAEAVLLALATKGIYVSTGSACSEGSEETSHVLEAIGLRPEIARSSIRFSLGRFNTEQDIEIVLKELPEIIAKLREISSFEGD